MNTESIHRHLAYVHRKLGSSLDTFQIPSPKPCLNTPLDNTLAVIGSIYKLYSDNRRSPVILSSALRTTLRHYKSKVEKGVSFDREIELVADKLIYLTEALPELNELVERKLI